MNFQNWNIQILLTTSFFFRKRPNVTIFLPNVGPVFQQFWRKKVVGLRSGEKIFHLRKINVTLRKIFDFPKWNIFFTEGRLAFFFVRNCWNVTISVIFCWKHTGTQRRIFKSETFKFCLLHRPFFLPKKGQM